MTGRTHDVAALAAVSAVVLNRPLPPLDAVTLVACVAATFVGGLAPDLDKPGSTLWRKTPGGCLLAWLARPVFVGGHRHLSHSLLGTTLFGAVAWALLHLLPEGTLRPEPVWVCFLVAYFSHLAMDTLTEGGIPWFFPFGGRLGFPPVRWVRIKSGGWFEHTVVLPLLWLGIFCTWRAHLPQLFALVRSLGTAP